MRQKSLDKRLQSEKRRLVRKEKSKEAARCRRGKEGEVFTDITDILPVADSVKCTLDKTSIIRLCINYIRTRELLPNVYTRGVNSHVPDSLLSIEDIVEVLHGFIIMLSPTGEIVYVTSNIKQLLGLCEYDMIGHSLDAYIHPCDWEETEQKIKSKKNQSLGFTARFKSTLSSRSRGTNFKSSAYKVVKLSGQRISMDVKPADGVMTECVILTATPIEHPSVVNQPLDSMTFTTKHSLDMKFTESDKQAMELTLYPSSYMLGKSLYDFVHPSDIKATAANFKALSSKEHIQTDPYMFLTCGGGYIRVITQASVSTDSKTNKPKHVLCVHSVISEVVGRGIVLADIQTCDGIAKVKTESSVDQYNCHGCKPTQQCDDREESYVLDDIFDATAGVFMDPADEENKEQGSDLDIMRVTESIFGEGAEMQDHGVSAIDDVFGENVSEPDKRALEALVEQLDNEDIDMNKGLFVDLPDVEEKDFYLRAPYIPMEDFTDMPIIDNWGYDEPATLTDTKVNPGWNSYRQEEVSNRLSNLSSPVSSHSPGTTTTESLESPLATSPWQLEDNSDLTSDLEQLSYAHDHDSYSKDAEQALCSLADSCLTDRLSVSDAEISQAAASTTDTWSDGTYVLHDGVPKQAVYHLPNNCLTFDAPKGQQYGYTRRKRKVEDFNVIPSVGQGMGNVETGAEPPYKTGHISSAQVVDSGQSMRHTQGPSQRTVSYRQQVTQPLVSSGSTADTKQWSVWATATTRPTNLTHSTSSLTVGRAKPLPRVVKVVNTYNNSGWLQTMPRMSQEVKYKPTQHRSSPREIDRDKDSLLLNLLQQQT